MRLGFRSIRVRVVIAVMSLCLLPAVAVRVHQLVDRTKESRVAHQALDALRRAETTLDDLDELNRVAWSTGTRIRVLDPNGTVIHHVDHDATDNLGQLAGQLAFGQRDWPSVWWVDGESNSLAAAPWFEQTVATGHYEGCTAEFSGELLVCRAAAVRGDLVVEVSESSREAVRALHDAQPQLLKITLLTLPFSALLGLFFAHVLASPARRLVRDIEERRASRRPGPLGWRRRDEFGQIATAFDGLTGEMEARRQTHAEELADLAHQLKNPVSALSMAGEALTGPKELSPERRERLARTVTQASARLDHAIGRFLALASAEAGPSEHVIEPVDVCLVVRTLAGACGAQSEQDAPPRWVDADPVALATAIENVLDNAVSFASAPERVRARSTADGTWVSIIITDDGPGLPGEPRRIFERFYTQRDDGTGTGLGLAITRAVVIAHGGRVHAESGAQGGAMITLQFPQSRRL